MNFSLALIFLLAIFVQSSGAISPRGLRACADYLSHADGEELWGDYARLQQHFPPNSVLERALRIIPNDGVKRTAIELGVGAGTEILAMVRRGFQVVAVDKFREPIRFASARLEAGMPVQFEQIAFEDMELKPQSADLVNAVFALHLVTPERFPHAWAQVVQALKPGGIFAGTFFGPRDDWAGHDGFSIHNRTEILRMFIDFRDVNINGIEFDLPPAGSREFKHWHIFAVTARRL